ncbi:hypothetical protein MVEN_00777200 [Mycena venus]|uniref:Uncharacterized protein n=1 Tax=Mycena venus TaxID=2733690 RepID=A0A8H6YKQ2_9AGAR|nr:hypothetical protein MVEN_00777200 [Mycena venus]
MRRWSFSKMGSAALAIDMIVVAAGETRLVEYVKQTFPPEVATLGNHTVDNAADWLDVDRFTRWLSQTATQRSPQSATLHDATSPHVVRVSEGKHGPYEHGQQSTDVEKRNNTVSKRRST